MSCDFGNKAATLKEIWQLVNVMIFPNLENNFDFNSTFHISTHMPMSISHQRGPKNNQQQTEHSVKFYTSLFKHMFSIEIWLYCERFQSQRSTWGFRCFFLEFTGRSQPRSSIPLSAQVHISSTFHSLFRQVSSIFWGFWLRLSLFTQILFRGDYERSEMWVFTKRHLRPNWTPSI